MRVTLLIAFAACSPPESPAPRATPDARPFEIGELRAPRRIGCRERLLRYAQTACSPQPGKWMLVPAADSPPDDPLVAGERGIDEKACFDRWTTLALRCPPAEVRDAGP